MTIVLADLSRATSKALRHEPWLYELELDDEGWTSLETLLTALRQVDGWAQLQRGHVEEMIDQAAKRRHEIRGDRIRALYGHSLPGKLVKTPGEPPAELFHGTSEDAARSILASGLRPMGRQYVHLSVDQPMACEVGRRKSRQPVILQIDAGAASSAGVPFFVGNEMVWLAATVPAEFIHSTT